MDFNVVKSEVFCDFSCAEVVDTLREVKVDEAAQLDALTAHFSLSHEAYLERVAFTDQLASYLQQFFVERVIVRPFGSTTTGLAFYNSDLDLNFIFSPDNVVVNANAAALTNGEGSTLTSVEDIDVTAQEPICKAKFIKFSNAERTLLLTKMINKFRKECANIASITSARNARYPVVRFDLRLPRDTKANRPQPGLLVCDLSIQNSFSERKANFIAEVCNADVSGRFRKFLFIIKMWAYCNRLFATKTDEHKSSACIGRWKSYTLSLLAVSFLQARGYIPALAMRLDTTCLAGWPVDCDLPNFDLSNISASKFLKEFFVFLYNTVRDSNVHCIREGKIVPKTRFKCDFNGCFVAPSSSEKRHFKLSLVNVQDPFELSHNVAAGVSRDALTHFRRVLMFSIVALKQQHEATPENADLASIFRINELEMSFVSSTSDNAAQNALQRKSANILVIPTGVERPPSNIVFDAFVSLLQDVLMLEIVEEPPIKRFRQRQDNGIEELSKESETSLRDGRSVEFVARHLTWLGRRQLRRKLMSKELIANSLPPLLLEREVSKGLCNGDGQELFRVSIQLHLAEVDMPRDTNNEPAVEVDDSVMDDDATAGGSGDNDEDGLTNDVHNTSGSAGSELYAIFRPVHSSTPAQCNACRDLMHFLSTFLAKHLPMLVGDVIKSSNNIPRPVNAPPTFGNGSVNFYDAH